MWQKFKRFLTDFCLEGSVHGTKYLIKDNRLISRVYWCFMLIFFVISSAQFSRLLWGRYSELPTQIVIKTGQALTKHLILPSVTFYLEDPMSNETFGEFLNDLDLPPQYSQELILTAMEYANAELSPKYKKSAVALNITLLNILDQILKMNNIKVRDYISNILPPCEKLMSRCQLRGTVVPCKDIFKRTYGYSCTFDDEYKSTDNSKSLFYNSLIVASTEVYGDAHFVIHRPGIHPMFNENSFSSTHGTYMFIYIDPIFITTSENVQNLNVDSRGCVNPDELKLRFFKQYGFLNCGIEQIINASLAVCGCVAGYYPVPDEYVCNFTQMICLNDHHFLNRNSLSGKAIKSLIKGKDIEIRQCPNDCHYYRVRADYKPRILVPDYDYTGFLTGMDTEQEYVIQFNYENEFYTIQETQIICDWITLISSLGGVYGLFLGCSCVTLAEIIYFLWSRVLQ